MLGLPADLAFRRGAGDGNRTRTISLETNRSGPLTALTWISDVPLVTATDSVIPGLMARQWPCGLPGCPGTRSFVSSRPIEGGSETVVELFCGDRGEVIDRLVGAFGVVPVHPFHGGGFDLVQVSPGPFSLGRFDEPQARQCAQLRMVTRCAAEVGLSKGTDGLRVVLSRPALRPRSPPTSRSWRSRWP